MLKIDDIDMLILSELSNDSSISIPKLAKKTQANPSVIYARIKNLVKKNVIKRFTIIVNDKKLGYGVKSLIGVNMDSKMHDSVISVLLEINNVRKISEVTGRFDILITVYAKTLDQMHDIVSNKIGKIDGVVSSESFIEMISHEKPLPYTQSAVMGA